MTDDRRLIEDYLPIKEISAEASREKSVRKGHISTLHLWWARRPLVACRAAVYGALVPASQFMPNGGTDQQKKSLGRANAAKFIARLCKYPGDSQVISEARQHILAAHAERLMQETGETVTVEDILAGRAPRPKVLDMFAGGGAIPLEALRLGCDAYALDLNPVAHIIELCTLVYPQKYGKPDLAVRGMTGAKNTQGETTWGGLAEEVRYWGKWVLEKVKADIGDLYPLIPDPKALKTRLKIDTEQFSMTGDGFDEEGQLTLASEHTTGMLTPVAYLWTRTVPCKNPSCGATVPLVRQTWLCKKKDCYVAMRMIAPNDAKRVKFKLIHSDTEEELGFDPAAFSIGGNATCPFCGSVADSDYVKAEGCAKRLREQMMAIVCIRPDKQGKVFLSADDYPQFDPNATSIRNRIEELCKSSGLTEPNEQIVTDAKNCCWTYLYGLKTFKDLFLPRQLLCQLSFAYAVHESFHIMLQCEYDHDRMGAISSYMGVLVDRLADYNGMGCTWESGGQFIGHTFTRQAIPLVWDFVELAPFGEASGSPYRAIDWIIGVIEAEGQNRNPATVMRGSATSLPWPNQIFEAVITDPPYYDNVSYANLSDFFYIWLRRTIGHLFPEHFASEGTPKKSEAVSDATRHHGVKEKAQASYEEMMATAFRESNRILKPSGIMVVVYAHKTTLGWSTLVDALRKANFTVTEAWPLDTERSSRFRAQESAALASSIFLVAQKREGYEIGNYELIRPDLEEIVRERVDSLWLMGITGADLVIAAVGAGLRAFTKYSSVEYANGEEVPAEKFLAEVEGVVLETLLEKIFGVSRSGVAGVDVPTRFYVLWRYTYRATEIDAGEAIVFTYGQHVELDGPNGLSA